jgi:hypothetical protein
MPILDGILETALYVADLEALHPGRDACILDFGFPILD